MTYTSPSCHGALEIVNFIFSIIKLLAVRTSSSKCTSFQNGVCQNVNKSV